MTNIVYNDLKPAANEKASEKVEQIDPHDPGLIDMWTKAAQLATEYNYCNFYDTLVKRIGGYTRAELDIAIGEKSWYYFSGEDKKGNARKHQKIEFKAVADIMGTSTELVWSPRLYTSGTREDINEALRYYYGGSPQATILEYLEKERTKAIRLFVKEQTKTNALVLA